MDIGTLTGGIEIENEVSGILNTITSQVQQFAETFDGAMGFAAKSVGVLVLAVGGLAASIIALGNTGSAAQDVVNTFEQFTGSAQAAAVAMEQMREGTRGTVTDLELMQRANKLLAADVKLTADQFGLLSNAAFVLADQGLGSVEDNLNLVSQAMLTGRARALEMKIGKIDLKQAEMDFAASLGTTRNQLSEAGILEARRIAILDALNARVQRAGEIQKDFGDIMKGALVSIQNWGTELARLVSISPNVMQAVNTIGDSLKETFGTTSDTLMKNIVAGINNFADTVTRWAPTIISAFGSIRDKAVELFNWFVDLNERFGITDTIVKAAVGAWNFLKSAFDLVRNAVDALVTAWQSVPDWLKNITQAALAMGVTFGVAAVAIDTVSTPLTSLIKNVDLAINILGNLSGTVYNVSQLIGGSTALLSTHTTVMGSQVVVSGALALAYANLMATVKSFTIVQYAYLIAGNAVFTAQQLWAAGYLGLLSIIQKTTVAQTAMNAMSVITTTVTSALTIVTSILAAGYTALTARIGLASTALAANRVAILLTTAAAGALGTALLAVQYVLIPLVALWAAWNFTTWLASFPRVQAALDYIANKLGLISDEAKRAKDEARNMMSAFEATPSQGWFDMDPALAAVQRRFVELGRAAGKGGDELDQFVKFATDRFKDLRDNGSAAVIQLQIQLESLMTARSAELLSGGKTTIGTSGFHKLADELRQLKENGAQLTVQQEQLLHQFPALKLSAEDAGNGFLKVNTDAEDFLQQVETLTKSLRTAGSDLRAFAVVFRSLTDAKLGDIQVQQQLVPLIEQYSEAFHGQLTPAMREVYDNALRNQQAFREFGIAQLETKNITLEYVQAQKDLGFSDKQIATQLGVSTQALQLYLVQLTDARKITDDLVKAQDALIAQQGALEIKQVESAGTGAQQDLQSQFDRRLIGAQQFATQSLAIENATAARKLQIEMGFIAAQEAIEQRNLDQDLARLKLRGVTDEQFNQMRLNIIQKYSIQRTAVELTEADRVRNIHSTAQKAINQLQEEYTELVRSQSETRLDTEIRHIEEAARKRIADFRGNEIETQRHTELVLRMSTEQRNALFLDMTYLKNNSQDTLKQQAGYWRDMFNYVDKRREEFGPAFRAAMEKAAKDAEKAASTTAQAWMVVFDKIGSGLRIAAAIADQIPGQFGDIASKVVGHISNIAAALAKGDWIGAAVAGIAAIGDALRGIFQHPGRQSVIDFAETFDTSAAGTGFDELHARLSQLGSQGEKMWVALTGERNEAKAAAIIKRINEAFAKLDADIQKYNLTWVDLIDAQTQASAAGVELADTYERLVDAGFEVSRVQEQMSEDISDYIVNAVDAGVQIPAAMRPIIESMIRAGTLTQDAANAILGLRDSAMPSLADITEAADRYGISLDQLGPKVAQLQITELANQYVADWNILTAATDDWGVIIDKMKPKVQDLILDAIKYGSELPAAMKPMIQAFIDAGALVDENGDKLTDLSRFNFAKPLEEMVDALISKLDELIETLTGPNGVKGAFDRLGGTRVNPINIPYTFTATNSLPTGGGESPEPEEFAAGGIVYAATGFPTNVLPFKPKGTDVIPAMLTPGEGIVTTKGMQALGASNLTSLNIGGPLQIEKMPELVNRIDTMNQVMRDLSDEQLQAMLTAFKERNAQKFGEEQAPSGSTVVQELSNVTNVSHEVKQEFRVDVGGISISVDARGADLTDEGVIEEFAEKAKRAISEKLLDLWDEGGKEQTRVANVTTKRGAA